MWKTCREEWLERIVQTAAIVIDLDNNGPICRDAVKSLYPTSTHRLLLITNALQIAYDHTRSSRRNIVSFFETNGVGTDYRKTTVGITTLPWTMTATYTMFPVRSASGKVLIFGIYASMAFLLIGPCQRVMRRRSGLSMTMTTIIRQRTGRQCFLRQWIVLSGVLMNHTLIRLRLQTIDLGVGETVFGDG